VERERPDPAVEAETLRVKEVRDRIASELELDPSILASRTVIEEIGRRRVVGEDPWGSPDLRAWQRNLLASRL
jgi:ribonuclease D